MSRTSLNLGILAHVDAGKTTLTERLLHAAGVIETVGSVDKGTTQTDWLPLERERGITIKAAVVSFTLDDVVVNLIDTPGHPDFIAEVERVLGVLDGVVLVVSAVEGVQPQTRLLMRVLRRLAIPTIVFVNKIDRTGASPDGVFRSIRSRLTSSAVALGSVRLPGTKRAELVPFDPEDPLFLDELVAQLAEADAGVLAALDGGTSEASRTVHRELARQVRAALVHPVLFGSALSGAGVPALVTAVTQLLPARSPDVNGPLSGSVFKIERGPKGEKLAYVRLFAGALRRRERVWVAAGKEDRVTAISVFSEGALVGRAVLEAGQIGKVAGLKAAKIGDVLGTPGAGHAPAAFAPPTLVTRVTARHPGDGPRLLEALRDLAEQDPLIAVRHDGRSGDISVSLYGEVQKEVIQATLEREYGVVAGFERATPLFVERPSGRGEAVEVMHGPKNPFDATVGFRLEPGAPGSGVVFGLAVEASTVPLFLFKTIESFTAHMGSWVSETLDEGLYGWQVTDCVVTMHRCLYGVADGPPSRRGATVPSDFRLLTPIVLMEALRAAGSTVCEPMVTASLEVPARAAQTVLAALGRAGASIEDVTARGELARLQATLASDAALRLHRLLPELSGGEGVMETTFSGYRPCTGTSPRRPRTTVDPLDRQAYLAALGRHV